MPGRIRDFLRGQKWGKSRAHMQSIVNALNQLGALKGDGLVQVTKVAGIGYTFKLNLAGLLPLIPKPSQLKWGKAVDGWVAGEDHVHVDPCTAPPAGLDLVGKPNITGYIVSPRGGDPSDEGLEPVIAQNDILAYMKTPSLTANEGVLLNVKWALDPTDDAFTGGVAAATGLDHGFHYRVDCTQNKGKTAIASTKWGEEVIGLRVDYNVGPGALGGSWAHAAVDYNVATGGGWLAATGWLASWTQFTPQIIDQDLVRVIIPAVGDFYLMIEAFTGKICYRVENWAGQFQVRFWLIGSGYSIVADEIT